MLQFPGSRRRRPPDTVPVAVSDLATLLALAEAGYTAGERPAEAKECERVLMVAQELLRGPGR